MPNDEIRRKGTIPVKKGSAGPARRMEPGARAARTAEQPTKPQLDARQERISPQRRRGPDLPPGNQTRSRALTDPADVPETECDEPEPPQR
jgi:hypothetical protein